MGLTSKTYDLLWDATEARNRVLRFAKVETLTMVAWLNGDEHTADDYGVLAEVLRSGLDDHLQDVQLIIIASEAGHQQFDAVLAERLRQVQQVRQVWGKLRVGRVMRSPHLMECVNAYERLASLLAEWARNKPQDARTAADDATTTAQQNGRQNARKKPVKKTLKEWKDDKVIKAELLELKDQGYINEYWKLAKGKAGELAAFAFGVIFCKDSCDRKGKLDIKKKKLPAGIAEVFGFTHLSSYRNKLNKKMAEEKTVDEEFYELYKKINTAGDVEREKQEYFQKKVSR